MKRLFLAIQLISFAVASCFAMAFAAPEKALNASPAKKPIPTQAQKSKKKTAPKAVKKAPGAALQAKTNPSTPQNITAAANTTTVKKEVVAEAPAPAKKLSASVGLSRTNSLNDYNDGTEQASWDTSFLLGYKLTDTYSVSGVVERSDDIKDSENSDWAAAAVRLSHKALPVFNDNMKISPRLSVGLPISKAQRFASLQASLGLSTRFAANSDKLFSKKLSLSSGLGFTRNFHKYDTATSGAVNTQYSSTQDIMVGWAFTDSLELALEVVHYNTWSYQGTMREFYSHNQELSYAVNSQFSVAMGHAIGRRDVWNSDGSNYDYKLVDEDNSLVYGSLTYTY